MSRRSILPYALPVAVFLLLLLVYQYGARGLSAGGDSLRQEKEMKLRTLRKQMALLAREKLLEEELGRLKILEKATRTRLLSGETFSLAAANLLKMVKENITSLGGRVTSERVEKPEEKGPFTVVQVGIDAVVPDAKALRDLLYSLETRTPYIVIRSLDVRIADYRAPRELIVKMRLSGLMG
ncbi:MAG: hypothetical protein D6713_07835 [Deltaproteobacteria bacterium]|nr:MAG: hypothetical protein D6713_07835 [Deltaproteobacteria bacterium]